MAYEYVCGQVVDGCPHKIRGDDKQDVERKAHTHLRDVHAIEELDLERRTAVGAAIRRTYG